MYPETTETITCDVLVVGARCAGAATAMLLARQGLRVLAIDRATYGSDTVSTHALMRIAVMQLHRWGVLPAIQRRGTPAIRRVVFGYGKEVEEITVHPTAAAPALYAPRRNVLDPALVDAARAAGAHLRFGWMLLDLLRRPDGRVTGAIVQDDAGRRRHVRAGLVVGADGVNSPTARLAGARVSLAARHAGAFAYTYVRGLDLDGYRWSFRPGLSAGHIPTNDGAHCVFVAAPLDDFRAGMRADRVAGFRRLLACAAPDIAPATLAAMDRGGADGPPRIFAGQKGFLRVPHGPGWALVGDAGLFRDPITAHGISDALRDAELLARAVRRGSEAAMAGYAAQRDLLARPILATSDEIASFSWDLDAVRTLHRRLHAAMKQETAFLAALPDAAEGPWQAPAPEATEKAA